MIPRMAVPEELAGVASRQAGVVGREQVRRVGVSDKVIERLVRTGQWRRLVSGVYAVSDESWEQWVWAGVLVGGGTAVVGLRAAAQLWGLATPTDRRSGTGGRVTTARTATTGAATGVGKATTGATTGGEKTTIGTATGRSTSGGKTTAGTATPGSTTAVGISTAGTTIPVALSSGEPIEIYIGRDRRTPTVTGPWQFIRADRVGEGDPPRTSLAQTIVDLAATLNADQLASLVGQSLRRVRPAEVRAVLDQTRHHKQRRLLSEVLDDASSGVTSALERRYAHDVERAHGLPSAHRQAKPVGIYTVDNLYEDYEVIVELDSQVYHRGAAATQDLERDRTHTQYGFITLRYTWADVTDHPCRTATEIAATLNRRGWNAQMTACPRCTSLPVRHY